MNERDPQYILYGFVVLGIIVLLIPKVVAALMKKARPPVPPPTPQQVLQQQEQAEKCFCGEIAVEPYPLLRRSRDAFGFIREQLMMPPSYRREVPDKDVKKELCASHAHLADANVDEFIATSVRSAFVRAYQDVAKEASTFETQGLRERLEASLTDKQQAALRKREAAKKTQSTVEQKPVEQKPMEPVINSTAPNTILPPPAPPAEEKTT